MASQVPTSLNQQVGSLQLSGVAAAYANVSDLTAGGVQYPTTPGTTGQILGLIAQDTLGFISSTGTETLTAGAGITLTPGVGSLEIAVNPTTVCVPDVTNNYNFVAGSQPANLTSAAQDLILIGRTGQTNFTNQTNVVSIGYNNFSTSAPITQPLFGCVAIGSDSLTVTQGATLGNIAIGGNVMTELTTAGSNTNIGIGYQSCNIIAGGCNNVAIGEECLGQSGTQAAQSNNNIAIGEASLQNISTSTGFAMSNPSTGSNIAIGTNVMNNVTVGVQNIALGLGSGSAIVSGNNNVCIAANTYGAFTGPGDAFVPATAIDNQVSIAVDATSLVLGGATVNILEANTVDAGYMTSNLEFCPIQLSFGITPAQSEALGTGYNTQFPTEASILTSQGLGLAPSWMLGVESFQPPAPSTAGQLTLGFFNPTVMNVQEEVAFNLYCTPPITVPDGTVATGPVIPPYQLTAPIQPDLIEHSASIIFTRTGNVVQCYINGNTPAINWEISSAGGATTALTGEKSAVNDNYLSLCTAVNLNAPLTGEYRYAQNPAALYYGRVVALLTVGPESDGPNNIISSTMAPTTGTSFSKDFQVIPIRATPEAGRTNTPHYMAYPNRPATYLGACYSYSPLNAAANDQVGSVGTVRLTVTSFLSNASGTPTQMVAVCLSNVTHNYGTTNTRGTDRLVENFTDLVNYSGNQGVALGPDPGEMDQYVANTILRVLPQSTIVDGKDTANNDALYAIFFPENWEANGGGANNWAQIDDGGGEAKISLTYMVIPN